MNVFELAEYLENLFDADGEPKAAASMLRRQHEAIVKLRESLDWYVKEDEIIEGGKWDEINAYWIAGLRKAEQALEDTEEFK